MEIGQILVCPKCRAKLITSDTGARCNTCHHEYTHRQGFLDVILPINSTFRNTEKDFWDYAYTQEEERQMHERNSYFHHHFRRPLISLPPGSIILELGCGNRADALEIAQAGHEIVETDISWHALAYAKKLAQSVGVVDQAHFLLAEAEHLPFEDCSFNGVLIAAALHHLANPAAGLREMARVVKPGGYVVLGVEPNRWPYITIYRLLAPLKKYIRKKRQRQFDSIADDQTEGFSKKQLRILFMDAGLQVQEILPVKYVTELYDSYIRLKNRLQKKEAKPSANWMARYTKIDKMISKIPLINNFSWHWNVIAIRP